jgi:hypothetical protein
MKVSKNELSLNPSINISIHQSFIFVANFFKLKVICRTTKKDGKIFGYGQLDEIY